MHSKIGGKQIKRSIFGIIVITSLIATTFIFNDTLAAPGINKQIAYQGILKTGGVNATDGNYDMVFKIYSVSTGGSSLWTGTHTAANGNPLTVTNGIFNVMMGSGSGNALTVDFTTDELYLGVTVGTDSEMTPRKRIGAAGYAFNADTLDGIDSLSFIRSTRTITAGTGLTGGGDMSADRTLSLNINGLTAESAIANSDEIAIYDTSANAIRKITRANLLSGITGALDYQGTWNGTTNTPTISDGTGLKGQYHVVDVAGTQNLGSGNITFTVGDWAVHNGSAWEKLDNTNDVQTVFGRQGIVVATLGDYAASLITNIATGTISATNVQAALNELDLEKQIAAQQLTDIAALSVTDGGFIVGTGTNFILETGNTLRTSLGLGTGDSPAFTALTLSSGAATSLGLTRSASGEFISFTDGTDAFSLFNRAGSPEGQIMANTGSLAIDTANGSFYIKTSDATTTGWSIFGVSGGNSLQLSYNQGGAITTADNKDLDFILADTATDSNFDIDIATGGTNTVSISRLDGAGTADPAQLLLLENLDVDRALPVGLKIQAANASGTITTAIDVSDAEIGTALSVGANDLSGTNWSVTGLNGNITTSGELKWNAPYNFATLPNASTYHGMFAHADDLGTAYFSHTGNWLRLINEDASGNVGIGTTTPLSKLHITPSTAAAFQIDPFGTSAGNAGELRFLELVANGANYVGFKSPDSIATSTIWALPNAEGTSGQVLSTNGSSTLSWITAAGATTIDVLFDSTITAGSPVRLTNVSGTLRVSAVSSAISGASTTIQTVGVAQTADTGSAINEMITAVGIDKVVAVYGNARQARVGTISGTTISWGSAVDLPSALDAQSFYHISPLGTDKVIVNAAGNPSCDSHSYCQVIGTVSGNSISFGTPVGAEAAAGVARSAEVDTNKIVTIYQDSTVLNAKVGTITGTSTIAYGAETQINANSGTGNNAPHSAIISTAPGTFIVIHRQSSDSAMIGTACTVSGTTISCGSPMVVDGLNTLANDVQIVKVDTNKAVVILTHSADTRIFLLTQSGTTLTAELGAGGIVLDGTASSIDVGLASHGTNLFMAAVKLSTGQIIVRAGEVVGGNSITLATTTTSIFNPGTDATYAGQMLAGLSTGKYVLVYNNNSATNDLTSQVIQMGDSTDFDLANTRGIAQTSTTAGSTGTVTIHGGQATVGITLTPNTLYYLSDTGELTSTATQYLMGRALSTNSLFMLNELRSSITSGGGSSAIRLVDGSDDDTRIETNESGIDEDRIRFYTAGNQGMIIDSNGNVGIGNGAPSTILHIQSTGNNDVLTVQDSDGSCSAVPVAGGLTWSCSSDERLKSDIQPAAPIIGDLMKFSIKKFTINSTGGDGYGVIAQDVLEFAPEMVTLGEDGYYRVSGLSSWKLVKAIQEQQEQIGNLQALALGGELQGNITGNLYFENLTVGDAAFEGNIIVRGHATFNEDTVGQAKILAGHTSSAVSFAEEYEYQPIVTVTPVGVHAIDYGVEDISTAGFTIAMEPVQGEDLTFNWHAFGVDGGKIYVSDGSVEDIEFIVVDEESSEVSGDAPVAEQTAVPEQSSVHGEGSLQGEAAISTESSAEPGFTIPEDTTVSAEPGFTQEDTVEDVGSSASSTEIEDEVFSIRILSSELGFVRVREEPTTDSEKIGEVTPGEIYTYDDTQNGWYHINIGEGEYGWVSGVYAEVVVSSGNNTETIEAPTPEGEEIPADKPEQEEVTSEESTLDEQVVEEVPTPEGVGIEEESLEETPTGDVVVDEEEIQTISN